MEWLKSLWSRWKVQVSVVGGVLVVATAYGTCSVDPGAVSTNDATETTTTVNETVEVSATTTETTDNTTTTGETTAETTTTGETTENTTTTTTEQLAGPMAPRPKSGAPFLITAAAIVWSEAA